MAMQNRRKFDHEHALELYNKGKTISELSKIFNVAESCIYEAIINLGGKIRKKMTQEKKILAGKLYENGMTLKEIATELGVSISTVSTTLKNLSIKTRDNSRLSDMDKKKIISLYMDGMGAEIIGERIGVHPNHVRKIIKKESCQ